MSLSVKLIFGKKNQQMVKDGELDMRRFPVAEDVASNYEYLRAKIISIMPRLKNKAFRLYWKDDEGDMMAFSSDDELIEALGHVADNEDNVFCIYAEEVDDDPLPPANYGCVSDVGTFPPVSILQTAVAAYGPLIHGLLSASSQQSDDRRRHAAADVDSRARQREAADGSCCHGGAAAADDGRRAGSEDTEATERNDQPSASGCTDSFHVDDGNRAADEFLANIVSGLLNTFGLGADHQHVNNDTTEVDASKNASMRSGCKRTDSHPETGRENSAKGDSTETRRVAGDCNGVPSAAALSEDLTLVVESLKEMGFNDDDGQLSRLVATHGGQIERILNVIQTCCAAC